MKMVFIPYKWGGDDFSGFDCSGAVQELLLSVGAHPDPKTDYSAQMLFDYFSKAENHVSTDPQLGSLVFFGLSEKSVTHVAMCVSKDLMFEEGGGGSKVHTVQDAIDRNAYGKIRPIRTSIGIFLPEFTSQGTQ